MYKRGMALEDYLLAKKIDPVLFRAGEPARWAELEASFEGVHPNSFTAQKKFLLNDLRRRYLLRVPDVKPAAPPAEKPADPPAATVPAASAEAKPARPVVKRPAAVIRKPPAEN
jgi:hypothetical protein